MPAAGAESNRWLREPGTLTLVFLALSEPGASHPKETQTGLRYEKAVFPGASFGHWAVPEVCAKPGAVTNLFGFI